MPGPFFRGDKQLCLAIGFLVLDNPAQAEIARKAKDGGVVDQMQY